ncbi:glycosyltransferase family 2 protein [Actinomadura flavalba]|uniref:glycosyltransferase family 2 protein n=1 Tax=Actinomadura flavalba TaxID=1120938 RepID=UPI00039E0FA5|nr:glycosyltransferase family A protein [Actinomadura flavalba]
MPSAASSPRIAVVVTTAGRARPVERLLASLAAQTRAPSAVVVADQGMSREARDVIEEYAERLPVRVVEVTGGVSVARNAALRALGVLRGGQRTSGLGLLETLLSGTDGRAQAEGAHGGVLTRPSPPGTDASADVVVFCGERAVYGDDTLERAAAAFAGDADVVCGGDGPVTQRTVWARAGAACFYGTGFLRDADGFDERLGGGGSTPWQSGAEADLLLRALRGRRVVRHEAGIDVREPADKADPARERHLARGAGRVYQRHYRGFDGFRAIVVPLGAAVGYAARRRWPDARRHLHRGVGHFEGLTGVLLPRPRIGD